MRIKYFSETFDTIEESMNKFLSELEDDPKIVKILDIRVNPERYFEGVVCTNGYIIYNYGAY